MVRAARVRLAGEKRGKHAREYTEFECWARDCPFVFGQLVPGLLCPFKIELNNFVWSKKERLYLVPNRLLPDVKGGLKRHNARAQEYLSKSEKRALVVAEKSGDRAKAQFSIKQWRAALRTYPQVDIPADGRRVRARCPLCGQVSILSYSAFGSKDTGSKGERGRLAQSLQPP